MPIHIPDLRKYLREISIVVLSILIAFALNAWWADRGERKWERAQLEALHHEFTENDLELSQALEVHDLVQDRTDAMIEKLRAAPLGRSVEVADSMVAAVLITPTYDPALGTLEALLTSGGLGRFSNQELVALLAAWPGTVEDVTEDEQSVVRHVQTQLVPLLGSRIDLARVQALRSAIVRRLAHRVAAGESSQSALPGDTQQLEPDLAIISSLGVNQDYHRLAAGGLLRLRDRNARITEALEHELGR